MQPLLTSVMTMILTTCVLASAAELAVDDFRFNGPIGSADARIEKVGRNDFRITLGHPPSKQAAGWPNHLQFQIVRNAKGNDLHITARFEGETFYGFNTFPFSSWSYDGTNWQKMPWSPSKLEKSPDGRTRTETAEFVFPTLEQDTVWFGYQVPMSYDNMLGLVAGWKTNPAVAVRTVGQSLGKRDLIRLEITDPQGPYPRAERWVHYFANQHPGEYNSMWRMAGMIDWLLGDQGADARRRFLCHFVIMMCPDGPSSGWHLTNAQGMDMDVYCHEGPNRIQQGHETYLWQKDLESIMASDCPATTIWSMHACSGLVRPRIMAGPETGSVTGPPSQLAEILTRLDPTRALLLPLTYRGERMGTRKRWTPPPPGTTPKRSFGDDLTWWEAPRRQFGVTSFEVEGGGSLVTKQENLDSGVVLIRALAEYYPGLRGKTRDLNE